MDNFYFNLICLLIELSSHSWKSHETSQSLSDYVSVLKSSDLTLCPVGLNSESYRIYEALSVGSLPVVEDRVVTGSCAETP